MTLRQLVWGALLASATRAGAQTDYYNTGSGRPLRVEDALPLEYRGIELSLAPLRFARSDSRVRHWSASPQLAVGILPRTELHVAFPLEFVDTDEPSPVGLAGVEVSTLYALNAETSSIPALALGGDVVVPAGPLGADATYASFKAIATRTFRWARVHANASFTLGPTMRAGDLAESESGLPDVSRWWAGLAIDKTFPLRSLLISAETFADRSVVDGADVSWNAAAGVRYQLTPRWAIDGGGLTLCGAVPVPCDVRVGGGADGLGLGEEEASRLWAIDRPGWLGGGPDGTPRLLDGARLTVEGLGPPEVGPVGGGGPPVPGVGPGGVRLGAGSEDGGSEDGGSEDGGGPPTVVGTDGTVELTDGAPELAAELRGGACTAVKVWLPPEVVPKDFPALGLATVMVSIAQRMSPV